MSDHADKTATGWYLKSQPQIVAALKSRLGATPDLQDLAQEVYLRLLRVEQPELIRNPSSYVYRVALNVEEEWRLRAAQALEHSSEPLEAMAAGEDPEDSALRSERHRAMRKAIEALPPATRNAMLLHVQRDMTYEQVAVHLGVSRRAVKRYILKGYAATRAALAGIETPAKSIKGKSR